VNRLKIVWFTGFSTEEIQKMIVPFKQVKPFAPWIPAA